MPYGNLKMQIYLELRLPTYMESYQLVLLVNIYHYWQKLFWNMFYNMHGV